MTTDLGPFGQWCREETRRQWLRAIEPARKAWESSEAPELFDFEGVAEVLFDLDAFAGSSPNIDRHLNTLRQMFTRQQVRSYLKVEEQPAFANYLFVLCVLEKGEVTETLLHREVNAFLFRRDRGGKSYRPIRKRRHHRT